MLDKIDGLAGTTPWILKDFRSPRRVLPGIQDFYNMKGVMSDKGEKKKSFFVLKRWYEGKLRQAHFSCSRSSAPPSDLDSLRF